MNAPETIVANVAGIARDPYLADRAWLDCVIEREIRRLRARYELSLDELRGLYVSDRQVDELLRQTGDSDADPALSARAASLAGTRRADTPLRDLSARLGLSRLERDVLVLALAPELDLRYETLYAYLNNDATRRHLSVDLAIRLLAPVQPRELRAVLSPSSRLFISGVLEAIDPGSERRSALGGGFVLSALATQFLLGLPLVDTRLPATVRFLDATTIADELHLLTASARAHVEGVANAFVRWPRLLLATGQGAAEQIAAIHYAATLRGLHTLLVPLSLARNEAQAWIAQQPRLRLLAQLAGAVVLLHDEGGGSGSGDPHTGEHLARALRDLIGDDVPVAWATGHDARWPMCVGELPHEHLALPEPASSERALAWRAVATRLGMAVPVAVAGELAARFVLPLSRIHAAVHSASYRRHADADATRLALWRAAKAQSAQGLANLATRVCSPHGWQQITLPDTVERQLREFTRAIAQRETVYREWDMATRTGRGTGLMALFAGASGTGKSMAAAVVANEIGLDLFRIDLSSVVSKYIGETEKNLDRIFAAARDANALLFFDEADALLGKRSEVKDAHDRYANIEVAYLLQKLEEHNGVVVLATNLAKNIDQAFARRMHYVVEFPRPDAALRERLWRGMFPAATPLAPDLDFALLAAQFETSGGEIQAIALEAAFLASSAGQPIAMTHLMQALTRHQVRQGNPAYAARTRREAMRAG